jgi:hypothetical protein
MDIEGVLAEIEDSNDKVLRRGKETVESFLRYVRSDSKRRHK